MFNHHQITHKSKTYGFWTDPVTCEWTGTIRSESNPDKTPYLRKGGTSFQSVRKLICQWLDNQ
jgi:hypothetical protein